MGTWAVSVKLEISSRVGCPALRDDVGIDGWRGSEQADLNRGVGQIGWCEWSVYVYSYALRIDVVDGRSCIAPIQGDPERQEDAAMGGWIDRR